MIIKLTIKEILIRKGITQRELAQMVNLREATISEMVNNSRKTINKEHLILVMKALKVNDLHDVIKLIS